MVLGIENRLVSAAAAWCLSSLGGTLFGFADRAARQRRLRRAKRVDLLLALLAARLSDLAYLDSPADVITGLRAPPLAQDIPGGLQLCHFRRQRPETGNRPDVHPQWLLARGKLPTFGDRNAKASKGEALYLAFRGTSSTSDLIRDICVEPEAHKGRDGIVRQFHGGFLKGVRDDRELHNQLRRALKDSKHQCSHLYIVGHSLGGSLAFTMAAAGLVPSELHEGPITVVALGAPPPIQQQQDADGKESRNSNDDKGDKPPVPPPRYLLVVNDCDVVPRLLGSPMPVATAALLAQSASSKPLAAVTTRNLEIMETMQSYTHPKDTEAILLREGGDGAKEVPSSARSAVLHWDQALSTNLVEQHMQYTRALEVAAALSEAWEDDASDLHTL